MRQSCVNLGMSRRVMHDSSQFHVSTLFDICSTCMTCMHYGCIRITLQVLPAIFIAPNINLQLCWSISLKSKHEIIWKSMAPVRISCVLLGQCWHTNASCNHLRLVPISPIHYSRFAEVNSSLQQIASRSLAAKQANMTWALEIEGLVCLLVNITSSWKMLKRHLRSLTQASSISSARETVKIAM